MLGKIVALALVFALDTPGSPPHPDAFVLGANNAWLEWGIARCGLPPRALDDQAQRALDPEQYDAGRAAVETEVAHAVREGTEAILCQDIVNPVSP